MVRVSNKYLIIRDTTKRVGKYLIMWNLQEDITNNDKESRTEILPKGLAKRSAIYLIL